MADNAIVGVMFHWLGGLASGSFYVPYKGVKRWAWETYWLVGGFFSWIIAPWVLALILVPHLFEILGDTPPRTLAWAYFWGAMWGMGGLTFGLTMRFLGMSLGMALALNICSAFGTLVPPIYEGTIVQKFQTAGGLWVMAGIIISLIGIGVCGAAGISKEKEMSDEEKRKTVKEFNFTKGILVALFSGAMSASFSFGLNVAEPMVDIAHRHGLADGSLWTGLPKLVVVLLGGFTSNFIWCVILHFKNGTAYQYLAANTRPSSRTESVMGAHGAEPVIESATDAPGIEMAQHTDREWGKVAGSEKVPTVPYDRAAVIGTVDSRPQSVPLGMNYFFCAIAGVTWYFQFFFYTMGETQMGKYKFSSWTLHMSSIIIFSTLWGIALKEWKGASSRTKGLLTVGLAVLVGSTMIVGYGNYVDSQKTEAAAMSSH